MVLFAICMRHSHHFIIQHYQMKQMIADLHSELAVREASKRDKPLDVLDALTDPMGSSTNHTRPTHSDGSSDLSSGGWSREVHRPSVDFTLDRDYTLEGRPSQDSARSSRGSARPADDERVESAREANEALKSFRMSDLSDNNYSDTLCALDDSDRGEGGNNGEVTPSDRPSFSTDSTGLPLRRRSAPDEPEPRKGPIYRRATTDGAPASILTLRRSIQEEGRIPLDVVGAPKIEGGATSPVDFTQSEKSAYHMYAILQ